MFFFIKINFSFSRFSPFLFVFVGPGLYRKLREVKGFISSKFGPNPTYWGRVMSNTVSSFLIVLISNCPGGGFDGPGGGFGGPGGRPGPVQDRCLFYRT